ncbi:MAG: type II toxin-antitoxin system VapC family toxin [Crocosphaera sp.]
MIIVDTGFWVALANKNDKYHEKSKDCFARYSETLITTWCVVTETTYFLQSRRWIEASITFIIAMSQGLFTIFQLNNNHVMRMQYLMNKYKDQPMDLADASLVVLAEEIRTGRILTLDIRDFSVYQWNNKKPFNNLFIEYMI